MEPAKRCQRCKEAAEPGHSLCLVHLEYFRKRRAWLRKNGRCIYCAKRAEPGKSMCTYHREYHERVRELAAEQGRCLCGKPAEPGRVRCAECLKVDRRGRARRVSARDAAPEMPADSAPLDERPSVVPP